MENGNTDEKFLPKGAIAFFAVVLILALIIWFGIYYLLIVRS